MEQGKAIEALRRRYARLAGQLGKLDLVLQGTIRPRTIVRPDPASPRREKTYGPYYQWTWKDQGKTITVNLTAPQANAFGKAIASHQKLENTIGEMRAVSLRILQATTRGVEKRKHLK